MFWIFIAYLGLTMLLGLWQALRTKSQSDFVLGGLQLPGWMLALSERATGESAWLLLGFSGMVYATGLSGIWIGLGCLTGIVTAWVALARKFRQEAKAYNALTMPEYFSAKFPRKANTIRLLSTFIIVFFFIFYVGAQFNGAGEKIVPIFGFDPVWGQIVAAAVILAYATVGGFISVVAVDTFQSLLMITTLVVTPIIMLVHVVNGPTDFGAALAAAGPGMDSLTGTTVGFAAGLLIFNNFAWFFGYLGGQPQLNARFMGMRDDRNVRIGRNIAIVWTVLAYAGVVLTGLCALVLYGPNAVTDSEAILPYVIEKLFPWWLAGILLAGAAAAMISTAQSMLLVAASSISQDVFKGTIRKGKVDDRTVLAISRVSMVVIGGLALALSLFSPAKIYSLVSHAWAGIGCSFAPAVLLSFYWDRFGSRGVITALLTGLITTVVWIVTGWDQTVTAMAVTFFAAIGMAILVTLFTGAEEKPAAPVTS
jgi:sodium/proline symporter